MKFLLATLLVPTLCVGAIWPGNIGAWKRAATMQATLFDRPIWDEYGLKESEAARYENGGGNFTVTGYRLQETTGAMAAFDWQRPAKSTVSRLAPMAAETGDGLLVVHGNYLLSFNGHKPEAAELGALFEGLRNVDTTVLPTLPANLPAQDRVANSERYIIGPASLAKFIPGIPPSVAAFHYGAEAQMGVFHSPKGEMGLVIFSYPTPQIAMQKEADFRGIPGGNIVKRSGPLVAVVLTPPDLDAAERLLAQVKYRALVTLDQWVPSRKDNIGNLVINAFVLIGILLGFMVASGLAFGGLMALRRRGNRGEEADALTTLNLGRPWV
ncbi:MAG: hypothetical protein NTW28_28695 [Candidatus Solibacter sp.]|nr:hypothetical protein [Candidatus Solibacter sp.]